MPLDPARIPVKVDRGPESFHQTPTLHGADRILLAGQARKAQEVLLMRALRSIRWFLLALVLCLVPASSFAGVFISVGFAPPVLPVYEQPPCPEPGLMWTPGYWAYGDDGYFWVPGAWVPAPYEGALWTPGYWGWSGGFYAFHPGYWGMHVGYYGGVNYGFGYMGIGFVGGMWRGHEFAYNTEVVRVDERFVHTTYRDREIVNRYTVAGGSRVAYSGGPGGIRHDPAPEERMAERERHTALTSYQTQHESAARADRSFYAKNNGGHPATLAVARPLGANPQNMHQMQSRPTAQQQQRPMTQQQRPMTQTQQRPTTQMQNRPVQQPQAQSRSMQQPQQQSRPAPQMQQRPMSQPQSRPAPQMQQRSAPQAQSRPAPQAQSRPAPQAQSRPAPQAKPSAKPKSEREPK
jgi:hypothetical protein